MKTRLIPYETGLPPLQLKEEKINCPICGMPNACMVEHQIKIEPTNPPSDMVQEHTISSYLCMSCGYTSNIDLENNSLFLKTAISKSPKLVQDLAILDNERNIVWFPAVLNFPERGIIYPDGSIDNWEWVVSPYEPIPENELSKYMDEKNNTPKYTHRLVVEKSKRFQKNEFQEALKSLEVLLMEDIK